MKSRLLPSLLLLASATADAQKAAPQPVRWRELGPAPIGSIYAGRISAIAAGPTDAKRYFVAGADSGVWRTTDGGQTWRNLTDHMSTTAMGALAMDPNDENVLYAGTGEANYAYHSRYGLGIFRTTDGGESWVTLAESTFAGRAFSRILVDPADSRRVFAAVTRAGGFPELAAAKGHLGATGRRGVFLSTDSGTSWSPVALPDLSATDLALQTSRCRPGERASCSRASGGSSGTARTASTAAWTGAAAGHGSPPGCPNRPRSGASAWPSHRAIRREPTP